MEFDYYYGSQADQFSFIRIPRQLILNHAFAGLSIHAKILYAVLLDRMSLSLKNHWLDRENRVYIIYQVDEITQDLGFTKRKALDTLAELEAFGLISRKRRGRGLPNYLYVKNFVSGLADAEKTKIVSVSGKNAKSNDFSTLEHAADAGRSNVFRTSSAGRGDGESNGKSNEACDSRHKQPHAEVQESHLQEVPDSTLQEVTKSAPLMSYTDMNYISRNQTEVNDAVIHQSIVSFREDVMDQIGYDILTETYGEDEIEGITDLITEVLSTRKQTLVIGGESVASGIVKERFSRISMFHVEYVLDCMRETTSDIRNIHQYLLTAFYNAPATMPHYYAAKVNHDMYSASTGNGSRV